MQDLRERALEAAREHARVQEEIQEKRRWKEWERQRDAMGRLIRGSELPDELVDRIELRPDENKPWVVMDGWELGLHTNHGPDFSGHLHAEEDCPDCDGRRYFGPITTLADLGRFFAGERNHHECYLEDGAGIMVPKRELERERLYKQQPTITPRDLFLSAMRSGRGWMKEGDFATEAGVSFLEAIGWALHPWSTDPLSQTDLEKAGLREDR